MIHAKLILIGLTIAIWLPVCAFAAKEKFERKKPHVNVGTIGKVDPEKLVLTFVNQGDRDQCDEVRLTSVELLVAEDSRVPVPILAAELLMAGEESLRNGHALHLDGRIPDGFPDNAKAVALRTTYKTLHPDCIIMGAMSLMDSSGYLVDVLRFGLDPKIDPKQTNVVR